MWWVHVVCEHTNLAPSCAWAPCLDATRSFPQVLSIAFFLLRDPVVALTQILQANWYWDPKFSPFRLLTEL